MSQGQILPLSSPRWRELHTRRGEGAEWVTDALRWLQDDPHDRGGFREMWSELCAEERTYDAAYAAAPYLAAIASGLTPSDAREYLIVLGLITTYAGDVPADLAPGYRWAVDTGLALTLQALRDCSPGHELRYLLSAVAAFRSRTDLAAALQDVDAIQEPCPACGEVVHPAELQRIVEADQALSSRTS